MLFEVQYLQRRSIVIETFDLRCAEALVQRWRQDHADKNVEVVVTAIVPVESKQEAA